MKLVTIHPDNIIKEYIYFNEPIQNNIINESRYIRILYSTPNIVFNGIHVLINLSIDSERFQNVLKKNKKALAELAYITFYIIRYTLGCFMLP